MANVAQSPEAVVEQAVAQPVLTPLTASAVILVLTIDEGGEPVVHDLLSDMSGLARTVSFRSPRAAWQSWRGLDRRHGIVFSPDHDRRSCTRSRSSTGIRTGRWRLPVTSCSISGRR